MKIELNELEIELDGHQVEVFYYDSKKYNGIVFEKFDSYIASEFEVKDGLKNGIETLYYKNGVKESCSEYKNGLLDGLTKNYYETGELEEEVIFEYGICVSHKLYDKNGNIKEEKEIDKNSFDYKLLEKYRGGII
jgi:antitoxin component YwqK of YwqJK toxin-antitoxin module